VEGIIVEAGNGVTLSGEETEPLDVTLSDRCSGGEWDGMGAITETSSGVGRRRMLLPIDDRGGSSGLSGMMSAIDTWVDSKSQGLEDWLRAPNSNDD